MMYLLRYAFHYINKIILSITVLCFVFNISVSAKVMNGSSQVDDETSEMTQMTATELLEKLTPREKIGQLLVVSFTGTDTSPNSQIYQLITQGHIGGVMLSAANDNFSQTDIINSTWSMIKSLQEIENETSQHEIKDDKGNAYFPSYIPLFIGINQEGDGAPHDQILSGLTPQPNQMALGATWDPNLAEKVGKIKGFELSALGINMLFGPSLDILENPNPEGLGDMGTRTFGGDPFWVGEFAKAYIRGVHIGSKDRIALVGKHFAGRGGSDRLPDEEVATIRKSLEQLTQIELSPFFAVTGNASDPESTVDALMTSPIRYQGFQGNIRTTTKPLCFDPQALSQLMSLPALDAWRKNNGVLVSDDIGSLAVRRFFDPTEQTFNARIVARDALLAGNDLLLLGNVVSSGDPDSTTTILKMIEFFEQKYREDNAFAKRVDEAVFRILSLKLKIYPKFELQKVIPPFEDLENIGKGREITFEVAQKAATLIDPTAAELENILPTSPQLGEKIVFLTDTYTVKQCSKCPEQTVMPKDALQQAVVRLYGQSAGGQIRSQDLISFSSTEVKAMLEKQRGITNLEYYLRQARWIVISMLDVKTNRPESLAMRQFISERSYLLRNKNVIVFAFNAPYYLDSTNISKITAYYGLYSKGPQFIEVAARLLFNELRPVPGSLPVSVQGVGYDLISVIAPDAQQVIPLIVESTSKPVETISATESSGIGIKLNVGDLVTLRAGEIKDYNGHIVPDNTPVHFIITSKGEVSTIVDELVAATSAGMARATFSLKNPGTYEVSVKSEMAVKSQVIRIEVPGEGIPTQIFQPTSMIMPSPIPEMVMVPTPIVVESKTLNKSVQHLLVWIISVIIIFILSWGVYHYGLIQGKVRWSMQAGLITMLMGLISYSYAVLKLPGSQEIWEEAGYWTNVVFSIAGSGLSAVIFILYDLLLNKKGEN